MNRIVSTALGVGLALLVANASHAVPFFTKSAVGPAVIHSDNGQTQITFWYGTMNNLDAGGTGTFVIAATARINSTTPDPGDSFTNVPYDITLTITDDDSGQRCVVPIAGAVSGYAGQTQSNLTNVFTSPLAPIFCTLGANDYTIQRPHFVPPEPPAGFPGWIGVRVSGGAAAYTLADLHDALRWTAGMAALPVESLTRFDIVPNNRVDIADAARIARKVAGLETNP